MLLLFWLFVELMHDVNCDGDGDNCDCGGADNNDDDDVDDGCNG